MKQTYLLSLLFFSSLLSAQNVNIPNAYLKNLLVTATAANKRAATTLNSNNIPVNYTNIDLDNDGEISYSEASLITLLKINAPGTTLTDLTGIEAFINLKVLIIVNFSGTNFDLSQNTKLVELSFTESDITTLDVSNLIFLKRLDCEKNQLSELDLNANYNLTHLICNSNNLTSLDLTSQTLLTTLSYNYNNISSLNVTPCVLLTKILGESNPLSQLDLSQNVKLLSLYLNWNQFSSLDLSQNVRLFDLSLTGNNLSSINLVSNVKLENLYLSNNSISTLDLTSNIKLEQLNVINNNMTEINFSNPLLKSIRCTDNPINTFNTSQNPNLETVQASSIGLTSIDLSQNTLLQYLSFRSNNATGIDLSNHPNLVTLDISDNNFSSLSLSEVPLLKSLFISENNISTIDLTVVPYLETYYGYNTPIPILDFSQNPVVSKIFCANSQLTYLNLKNGRSNFLELSPANNPYLTFVCVDAGEISYVKSKVGSNVLVTPYCTLVPGGDYNTLTGKFIYDISSNGCEITDPTFSYIPMSLTGGGAAPNSMYFADALGRYEYQSSLSMTQILTPILDNPSYFNIDPTSVTLTLPIDNSIQNQDFCITAEGFHPDLEIFLNATTLARPGEDASYSIICRNKGNQALPASIGLSFNDAILEFVSSTISPNNIAGSTLQWEIAPLMPFQQKQIIATFNVNSPQENPAVNINDILAFSAYVYTPEDDTPVDNTFAMNQTVTGSYDPNDITCIQGNFLPLSDIGSYLHYNIRFENTGTGAAANIMVKNTINLLQYDIQSLRVLESSHPVSLKVAGNVAEFIFEGINLEPEVQGNVLYKIKTKSTLANNEVKNKAEIYFDYNFPIITNDELTVFSTLSNYDFSKDFSLQIYPNPAQDFLNVNSENTITSIQLYDSQGRLLTTKVANDTSEILDISTYAKGIYFVSVMTSVGKKTQKIIKK